MNKRYLAVAAAGLFAAPLLTVSSVSAAVPVGQTVDFSGESTGAKANGYATAANPDVHFYDTLGSNLNVFDYSPQSHGKGLGVNGDDTSALEIRLTNPANQISMGFGNDDNSVANATDQAKLVAYRGATQVGETLKNVNANDLMDQTISFKGKLFNRVTFQYVDAAENPLNLIEIVDDINVGPLCTIVGTPGNDVLAGTAGSDVICGDTGNDTINAGGGDDLVFSGPGQDKTHGGQGNDQVVGGDGADQLFGDAGSDLVNGAKKRDHCAGGPGHDTAISCEVKVGFP